MSPWVARARWSIVASYPCGCGVKGAGSARRAFGAADHHPQYFLRRILLWEEARRFVMIFAAGKRGRPAASALMQPFRRYPVVQPTESSPHHRSRATRRTDHAGLQWRPLQVLQPPCRRQPELRSAMIDASPGRPSPRSPCPSSLGLCQAKPRPRRRHRQISPIICAKSHVCLPETALGLRRTRRRRVVVTLFRRSNDIEVSISSAFDKEYGPGEAPGHSGIYRCRGCGCEIVSEALEPLPLEKHPKHSPAQGVVRLRLAVAAQPEPH